MCLVCGVVVWLLLFANVLFWCGVGLVCLCVCLCLVALFVVASACELCLVLAVCCVWFCLWCRVWFVV